MPDALDPSPEAPETASTPASTAVGPSYVLEPESAMVPAPAFVTPARSPATSAETTRSTGAMPSATVNVSVALLK